MSRSESLNLIGLDELPTIERIEFEGRSRASVCPVYVGDSVALCRILARYKFYVDTRDVGFGAHILLDGFWEIWLTTFISARVQPGHWVLDVGANHGYYTVLMADLVGADGRVMAVEPNPQICRLLRQSVAVNGFANRVAVLEQAATSEDGQNLTLCLPANEPKNAYLVASREAAIARGEAVVTVRGGRLATALRDWERLDFVKVDVEGAEEAAIEGLFPMLERHRPRMVLEFNLARCTQPMGLLERLGALYGGISVVGFDGAAHPVRVEELLDESHTEDWLLYLSMGD